jgi:small-conductance mechanosensitive channel
MTAAPPPPPPDAGPNPDFYGVESGAVGAIEPEPLSLAEAVEPEYLRSLAMRGWSWVRSELLTPDAALQILLVVLVIAASLAASRPLRALTDWLFRPIADRRFTPRVRQVADSMIQPVLILVLLLAAQAAVAAFGQPGYALRIAVSLAVAWIVIRLATHAIQEPFWARTVAVIVFAVAALSIFGLLIPTRDFLDSLAFPMGGARISALTLLRGAVLAVLLFWIAIALSSAARTRIDHLPGLTPSARLLLSKTLQLVLIVVAFMLALSSFGINFTALAVFSGALGLAVGFGLQRIFSNLVAGVILLLDRSIKPGDVIEVGQTYGYVKTLGLRYSSVVTRDNHEYLVPNEEFILNRVVNWSAADRAIRLKKTVRVDYSSDIRLAQRLMLEAAASADRVLPHPKPVCLVNQFGDDAVIMEIRFWISDPQNGVNNVTSDVLFAVWDRFAEHGVKFPFPQRDVHLRSAGPLLVRLADREEWEAAQAPAAPGADT